MRCIRMAEGIYYGISFRQIRHLPHYLKFLRVTESGLLDYNFIMIVSMKSELIKTETSKHNDVINIFLCSQVQSG